MKSVNVVYLQVKYNGSYAYIDLYVYIATSYSSDPNNNNDPQLCSWKDIIHWLLRAISAFVLRLSKKISIGLNENIGHFNKNISMFQKRFLWTLSQWDVWHVSFLTVKASVWSTVVTISMISRVIWVSKDLKLLQFWWAGLKAVKTHLSNYFFAT